MPIYEYACRDCQRVFEKLVRAWGEAVSCDGCHSANVEKRLSTFATVSSSSCSSSGGQCDIAERAGGCPRGGCACG